MTNFCRHRISFPSIVGAALEFPVPHNLFIALKYYGCVYVSTQLDIQSLKLAGTKIQKICGFHQ